MKARAELEASQADLAAAARQRRRDGPEAELRGAARSRLDAAGASSRTRARQERRSSRPPSRRPTRRAARSPRSVEKAHARVDELERQLDETRSEGEVIDARVARHWPPARSARQSSPRLRRRPRPARQPSRRLRQQPRPARPSSRRRARATARDRDRARRGARPHRPAGGPARGGAEGDAQAEASASAAELASARGSSRRQPRDRGTSEDFDTRLAEARAETDALSAKLTEAHSRDREG